MHGARKHRRRCVVKERAWRKGFLVVEGAWEGAHGAGEAWGKEQQRECRGRDIWSKGSAGKGHGRYTRERVHCAEGSMGKWRMGWGGGGKGGRGSMEEGLCRIKGACRACGRGVWNSCDSGLNPNPGWRLKLAAATAWPGQVLCAPSRARARAAARVSDWEHGGQRGTGIRGGQVAPGRRH